MVHLLPEDQAREHQRSMLAAAEAERAGVRARRHRRAVRRAERAERRLVTQWDHAVRLQAQVRELELTH
jgi:hypothetical protein